MSASKKQKYKPSNVCEHEGCVKTASFNFKHSKTKRFCASHKQVDMVNVKKQTCQHPSCEVIPGYNFVGLKLRLFCVSHKLEGMVNCSAPQCFEDGCFSKFNFEGFTCGGFCGKHKMTDMIDVTSILCLHLECQLHPGYNYVGLPARYCVSHKAADMVMIAKPRPYIKKVGTRPYKKRKPSQLKQGDETSREKAATSDKFNANMNTIASEKSKVAVTTTSADDINHRHEQQDQNKQLVEPERRAPRVSRNTTINYSEDGDYEDYANIMSKEV
jgi:hypothetical protein